MRDLVVHLAWITTHFIRTHWGEQSHQQWLAALTNEIEVLQAELHRTQRILNGYGSLLERCEKGHKFQVFGNSCIIFIIVLLTLTLWWSRRRFRNPTVAARLPSGDSPSSDELGSQEQSRPSQLAGPFRPSTLRGSRR